MHILWYNNIATQKLDIIKRLSIRGFIMLFLFFANTDLVKMQIPLGKCRKSPLLLSFCVATIGVVHFSVRSPVVGGRTFYFNKGDYL